MSQSAVKIVIVGGGSAGWLSASFLSKNLPHSLSRPVEVTLIEASDITPIGVGEATTPSLRRTMASFDVDEFEFMRACDATFKHGINFAQWNQPPQQAPGEHYFHPFHAPLRVGVDNLARHWLAQDPKDRQAFDETVGVQSSLARAGFAPKAAGHKSFEGPLSYAYHLDAGKLAEYLKMLGKKHGVVHRIGKVAHVERNEDGDIQQLRLEDGETFCADLFVDCTGFAARLIGDKKANPFVDKTDVLFCNKAIATRVPVTDLAHIRPYTTSTAHKAGWTWDIALQDRRGIGYVYSSKHSDEETAKNTLAEYVGVPKDQLDMRKLDMNVGYHPLQWRGNTVAIGLSAGFVEPLESTGIYLIEMAVWMVAQSVGRYLRGLDVQREHNRIMARHFENIIDFVKAHYCLSQRRDTPFWVENCNPDTIPQSLQDRLELWRADTPNDYDFDSHIICFNTDNYQYILYGMGHELHQSPPWSKDNQKVLQALQSKRQTMHKTLAKSLDPHAKLLGKIIKNQNTHRPTNQGRPMIGNIPMANNYRLN